MSSREPGGGDQWDSDAELDPWCVADDGAGQVLFGFATRHPVTGGLAWTRTSRIVHLDTIGGRAITRSGRRYALGHRITAVDLPDIEARLAFAMLIGPAPGCEPGRLPADVAPSLAIAWLSACKRARHLGLDPPELDPAAIRAVFDIAARGGDQGSTQQ
jgi:hypothetical protein